MPNVELRSSLVPVRTYPALRSWDLFPTINGTSGFNNDIGGEVVMPASCNRVRVYLACLIVGNASGSLSNPVGNPNLLLKGFDSLDRLMVSLPVGVHLLQTASNSITPKIMPLAVGYHESRQVNQASQTVAPQTYVQRLCQYGWSVRGGEMVNQDSIGSGSAGNAGVSDSKDNLVLSGNLNTAAGSIPTYIEGFAVTVAPWTIEAPVARWKLDGDWKNTNTGQTLGFSTTMAFAMIVFGLFVGEQV